MWGRLSTCGGLSTRLRDGVPALYRQFGLGLQIGRRVHNPPQADSPMSLSFRKRSIRQNLWGGPPGPRWTPSSSSHINDINMLQNRAGRRGRRPRTRGSAPQFVQMLSRAKTKRHWDKAGAKFQLWKEGDLPGPHMRFDYTKLTCRKESMQRFASAILPLRLRTAVIDKTGLTGEYNFVMTFVPDPN